MTDVDLDNCADEPIHVPGSIQPHGVLLAVSEPDLVVRVASADVGRWFGGRVDGGDDALGRPLADVVGVRSADRIAAAAAGAWTTRFDELVLDDDADAELVATLHRSDGLLVVEAEPLGVTAVNVSSVLRDAAMGLQTATSVAAVVTHAARSVRALTGFDRVMVYRFDADWNGEVVAEAKRDDLNSFLGLHYPATDIPAQARALYRRNWLRLIPDIAYRAVPLVPPSGADDGRPFDLGGSTLRSVSPIHVEYLTNMGVTASMSISILVAGELWGLIACHHYTGPHRPDMSVRNAAEHLGQLVSLRVAETEEADSRRRTIELTAVADGAADGLADVGADGLDEYLLAREEDVLKLAGASGAAVVVHGRITLLGQVPTAADLAAAVAHFGDDGVALTDRLGVDHDELSGASGPRPTAAGALGIALSSDRRDHLVWFRPELVRTVDWGGDPANAKLREAEGDHVRLSPRRSFDRWRETVRGRSQPWAEPEVRAAKRFARHLGSALVHRERSALTLATDLQRIMLPATLPAVPGFVVDAYYQPAEAARVGGDWYDVFPLDEHRVGVVVGDVAGHGLGAAAQMAQVRNGLRAYLLDDASPSHALARLNAMVRTVLPGTLATVACGVLDTRDGRLVTAHAGHLPMLVVDECGAEFLVTGGGRLLGVPGPALTDVTVDLPPGSTAVLYSDGLVERRRVVIEDSLRRLQREAFELLRDGARVGVARELVHRLRSDQGSDDVTLLIVSAQARQQRRGSDAAIDPGTVPHG